MFNNFLFWWVNCGTPANANTFYWKPKIKCTLLENSSKRIACLFHFLMKIALFICMLTVTCISFGASVRQVVKVWISKSWWCSKVRVCMIRRLFGAYECVIHAQLWNLHFRLWGVCVCGHDVLLPCDCVCLHPTVDGRGSERWRRSSGTEAEAAAITLSRKKDRMSE